MSIKISKKLVQFYNFCDNVIYKNEIMIFTFKFRLCYIQVGSKEDGPLFKKKKDCLFQEFNG